MHRNAANNIFGLLVSLEINWRVLKIIFEHFSLLLCVLQTLEYVSEDHGGRVQLAKAYYDALTKSLNKNFGGSGITASMEQCNDFFSLATKQISSARVGNFPSKNQCSFFQII